MARNAEEEIAYARKKIAELTENPHQDRAYNDSLIAFWRSALETLLKAQETGGSGN